MLNLNASQFYPLFTTNGYIENQSWLLEPPDLRGIHLHSKWLMQRVVAEKDDKQRNQQGLARKDKENQ